MREAMSDALTRVLGEGASPLLPLHPRLPGRPRTLLTASPVPPPWGGEFEQWSALKAAASEAVVAAGGTITHHHAVGRMHRPGYDRQRPDLFADAYRAAKRSVDPKGLMNPGVLFDP